MRYAFITAILAIVLSAPAALAQCGDCPAARKAACGAGGGADTLKPAEAEYAKLPGYNKRVKINEDYYFTYKFVKRPQIGTIILKVQVFTSGGKQVKDLAVTGQYDMPSMKGAHDSGPQAFKTNVKREYLLPVSLVMRGEWEVKLAFAKDGAPLYQGSFRFKI
ncbi:MAG: hypothetical protein MUF78_01955 [Candidatus Edwardsbacteria bacterium]|jgi:hypothetical protein|nr:hypothetical protein [Candidatus Edwardsbacteria bacterium]